LIPQGSAIRAGRVARHFREQWPLYAGGGALFALLLWVTRLRYTGGRMALTDLGTVDQALWTFVHLGRPVHSVNFPEVAFNWLGFHFSPLVLLLGPLYLLPFSPFFLQVVQVALVVSAAIPVCLAGRVLGLSLRQAQAVALLMLIHPFTTNGATWDFHEVAFAVPLIAWALYAIVSRRFGVLCVSGAALCLVKEHYGLALASLGILWAIRHRDAKRGLGLAAFGLAGLGAVLGIIMPRLSPVGSHFMTLSSANDAGLDRYGWLRLPLGEAAEAGVRGILLSPGTWLYLGILLFSFWGLSPRGGLFLLAGLADVAAALLSINPMPRSPFSYHALPLGPVLAVSAAAGLARFDPVVRSFNLTMAAVPLLALAWIFFPAPLPLAADPWELGRARQGLDVPAQPAVMSRLIRPEASVSAQGNIGYFFSRRAAIYDFPARIHDADAVALHLDYPFESFATTVFGIPFDGDRYVAGVRAVLADGTLHPVYHDDGWVLLLRGNEPLDGEGERRAAIDARLAWMEATYRVRAESPPPSGP